MRLRTFVAVNVALMGIVAGAWGDTFNFLGSSVNSWVGYAGASVPNLVTTTPGSIAAPAGGSRYGRLTNSFAAYAGSWRVGDKYIFNFDGVVSNNTALRFEFSNGAGTVAGLLGLQFVIVNAGNNADSAQINSLGGTAATLFDNGNFGGAAGVGLAQRVIGNITLSIASASTASVTGSLADSLGNLWTGPTATINLGTAPSSLFAAMNLNGSAGVSGITTLGWTLTPIPEPSTVALLTGLGLAGLMIRRRLTKKS